MQGPIKTPASQFPLHRRVEIGTALGMGVLSDLQAQEPPNLRRDGVHGCQTG